MPSASTRLRRFLLGICITLIAATPVRAQEVATSFDELRRLVDADETIYVTGAGGATVKGRVVDISSSALRLRVRRDAAPVRFSERDVNNIVAERADSWWNGALIGFGVGAGFGLLIEQAARTEYEKFSGGAGVGLGALGLATGLLIDVLNKETVTLFVH